MLTLDGARAWWLHGGRHDDVSTDRVGSRRRRRARCPGGGRVHHRAAEDVDARRARHVRRPHRRRRAAPRARRRSPPRAQRQGRRARRTDRVRPAAGRRRPPCRAAAQSTRPAARRAGVAPPRRGDVAAHRGGAAQRDGKGHRCRDRPPIAVDERDRARTPRPRRGDRVDRLSQSRRPSCAICSKGSASSRSTADSPKSPPTSAGVSLAGYEVSVGVPLAGDDAAIDGYRAVLANLRDAMLANWDGTVADIDPEFLHDLRVAVRRTRVVLANAGRVLPEDVRQRAREDFAWLGGISGTARDLDVYQIEWPDYTADSRRHRHRGAGPAARAPRRRAPGRPRRAGRSALVDRGRSNPWMRGTTGSTVRSTSTALGDRGLEPLAEDRRAADPPCPPGDGRTRADDHPVDARRDRARPAQGRQEAALPHRVLRRAVRQVGADGVRRPAQGAAGHPRRAPGRRGPRPRPAHDRRRPAPAVERRHAAGDRTARRAARAAPGGQPGRARRALRRLRHRRRRPRR